RHSSAASTKNTSSKIGIMIHQWVIDQWTAWSPHLATPSSPSHRASRRDPLVLMSICLNVSLRVLANAHRAASVNVTVGSHTTGMANKDVRRGPHRQR